MKTILRRTLSAVALAVCILFFSNSALAYDAPAVKYLSVKTDTGWTLQSDVNGVKAYYQVTTCDSIPAVFLRFVNSNAYDVTVSWEDQVKLTGEDSPRKIKTFALSVKVSPGEVAGITCSNPAMVELVSKPYLSADAVIEAFIFFNFTVTTN